MGVALLQVLKFIANLKNCNQLPIYVNAKSMQIKMPNIKPLVHGCGLGTSSLISRGILLTITAKTQLSNSKQYVPVGGASEIWLISPGGGL